MCYDVDDPRIYKLFVSNVTLSVVLLYRCHAVRKTFLYFTVIYHNCFKCMYVTIFQGSPYHFKCMDLEKHLSLSSGDST